MFIKTDLHLLKGRLEELRKTPTYSDYHKECIERLIDVIARVFNDYDDPDAEPACHQICNELWSATNYISGSTLKAIPYEIVYALHVALKDWEDKETFVITTAITEERQYSFQVGAPRSVLKRFYNFDMNIQLVQIAFPRLYRHRPLYNIALYHEMGHFIDEYYNIIGYSRLLESYDDDENPRKAECHRREYFADLIAASYVGEGYPKFIEKLPHEKEEDETHPSLENRLGTVHTFLNGETNQIISLFRRVFERLGFKPLEPRYTVPNIRARFENVLPYDIQSDAELHGIFVSGWEFLEEVHAGRVDRWKGLGNFEADRIANDLIEKSIRNRVITETWKHEAPGEN